LKVINDQAEDKVRLLIDKIYNLGFEVGYRNHSEIGWVLREYTRLMEEALNIGIQLPENYYNNGKIKGKASRDRGIEESSEKGALKVSTDHVPDMKIDAESITAEPDEPNFLRKPSLSDSPPLVERVSMVDVPKFLCKTKLLQRK